jgi:signal transduction histidine kinase
MTDLAERGERRDERRHGAPPEPARGGMNGVHLRLALLPAAAVMVLGIATVAFTLMSGRSVTTTRIVLVVAVALAGLVLIGAVTQAASATRRLQRQVAALRGASSQAADELGQLAVRAQRGEQPSLPPPPAPDAAADGDEIAGLAGDLQRERHAAALAVVSTAAQAVVGGPDQRVEVFVNLARRMQSLVHREIQLLDELEGQVEDPVLLKGLFTVDHLATRMRRQSESLAVLGGAVSRRQWSRPVTMHEVLRAAVAEVEQYSRVKVVPPVEGTLQGSAVTDVIHLVAELIENATKFSAPHTQAMLRAQNVTAGLVIDVEDRGLGMLPADQQRMNALLADPGRVNIAELLRDGRIGLYVVATLARRHGIRVQLQSNIYGGVQAVVVLPRTLIEGASRSHDGQQARPARAGAHRDARPAHDSTAPVPVVTDGPAPGEGTRRRDLPVRQPAGAAGPLPAAPSSVPAAARFAPAAQPPFPPAQPPFPPSPSPSPAPVLAPAPEPASGERPDLPRRVGQTHLAPELREVREPRRDDPVDDQLPGLMAAFQRGMSQAAEEDRPTRTDTTR